MNFSDKKTKLLLHKLGYLKLEIETKKLELQEHESEFAKRYQEKEEPEELGNQVSPEDKVNQDETGNHEVKSIDENKNEDSGNVEEKRDENVVLDSSQPDVSDDIKKIWKQIAIKTHPDRTGNDVEMTELYKRSLNAYNNGSYEEIIEIAIQLFIKIEQLSEKTLDLLDARAKELEKKLDEVKNNVLWSWAEAPEEKKVVIENMLRRHRKKKKRR